MKITFSSVFGLFYMASLVQGSNWSTWEPCSKTCSGGIQKRTLNCSSIQENTKERRDCINSKETQTRSCKNRPCSDFALKCFQCRGSEAYCHQNKLKRNPTHDACNKYHDRCIAKRFELNAGVSEVTRGCGRKVECRLAAQDCKRKADSHNRCHVTCCEEDYCNSSNQLLCSGLLAEMVFVLCVFLSVTM